MLLKSLMGNRDFKSTQMYFDVMALETEAGGRYSIRFVMPPEDAAALLSRP